MIEPEKKSIPEVINVNDEDRQILISLLQEYTEKLNSISSQIQQFMKFKEQLTLIIWVSSIIMVVIIFKTGQFFPYNIIIAFLIAFTEIVIFVSTKSQKIKIKSLEFQGKILIIKLGGLLRTTSQFQEHIEKSYIRKIELDLRLADAESALAYYDMVMKNIKDA